MGLLPLAGGEGTTFIIFNTLALKKAHAKATIWTRRLSIKKSPSLPLSGGWLSTIADQMEDSAQ